MSALRYEGQLSDSHQVVLILRLVLDQQARLKHGELVDPEAVCHGRFVNLSGLLDAVSQWLEQQRQVPASNAD